MADVRPFRGWRYPVSGADALDALVAPPYDVIDEPLRQRLLDRHAHNVIRLILGKEAPEGEDDLARYDEAAACLKAWRDSGVLAQEAQPAVYLYEQEFRVEGRTYTRRGFLARCRLEPFGQGCVHAHEHTLPGPKIDRLRLTRATRTNLSPIFSLYPDEANAVMGALAADLPAEAPVCATDHLGVANRLWPVTDPVKLARVSELMGPLPAFIADGHHRYETACTYRDELAQSGQLTGADDPANFVLMMFVSMSDPGLVIQPTHRLVSGLGGVDMDRLTSLVADHFAVTPAATAQEAFDRMNASARSDAIGLGTAADQRWAVAELTDPAAMADVAPDHSPAWRSLGVSVLHLLLLDRLVAPALAASELKPAYVHQVAEAAEAVSARACDAAFLTPAVSVDEVRAIAGNNEKMPPKSTYFYPKLLSGLLFNPLTA